MASLTAINRIDFKYGIREGIPYLFVDFNLGLIQSISTSLNNDIFEPRQEFQRCVNSSDPVATLTMIYYLDCVSRPRRVEWPVDALDSLRQ